MNDTIKRRVLCYGLPKDYKPEDTIEVACDLCGATMVIAKKKLERYLVVFIDCPKCRARHQLQRKTAHA